MLLKSTGTSTFCQILLHILLYCENSSIILRLCVHSRVELINTLTITVAHVYTLDANKLKLSMKSAVWKLKSEGYLFSEL